MPRHLYLSSTQRCLGWVCSVLSDSSITLSLELLQLNNSISRGPFHPSLI